MTKHQKTTLLLTQSPCTRLFADEEEHLVLFRSFLGEYEAERQYLQ